MRRFLLITFLLLVVLLVTSAGIGWYLVNDEAFLKSQLRSNALKYTGRELTFSGPVRLSLGRDTTFEAQGVHFANATWADEADMVAIGRFLISVNLPSLFDDKIIFPAFELDDCTVLLAQNDAGEANWDMLPESETEPKQQKPARTDLPVWFKDSKVKNCRINIATSHLEHPLDIEVADLAMQHHDDNRWESKGSGSVNDQSFSIDGWFAPFSALFMGGPIDHDLKFSLGDILMFQSSGSLQDVHTGAEANITTEMKGPDIAVFLNEFELPPFSEGPFDYKLALNTEGKMTKLDLDGDFGSIEVYAEGELDRLIKPSQGNVKISVDGPNLGALAKIFGIEGLVEDAFSHNSHTAFDGDRAYFKQSIMKTENDHLEFSGHIGTGSGFSGTELDVHFETREAGRWATAFGQAEQTTGPLTLDGKLLSDDNGLFSVQTKVVHEESALDVHGTLGQLPDAFAPDLEVSFKSPDPTPLTTLAGLKNFPSAPIEITGGVAVKDKQVHLDKVNIKLAGDQATIDGLVTLKDRFAGSDIKLGIDIRDAGDFGRLFGQEGLPEQAVKLSAEVKPDGKGLSFRIGDGNLGKIKIKLDGRIPDLQQPLAATADFDISLPRLSDISMLLPDMKLPDAPFTAEGKIESGNNRVNLKKVTITIAESRANLEGNINLVDRYAGSELNFDLYIKHARELGRMFGKDGLPDQPLQLTAMVKPAGKGLDFKVSDGNLGDIELNLEGRIADLDKPAGVDATFDIKLPRLSNIAFLIPNRDLPDAPFAASGRLNNRQTRTQLDQVQIKLGRINASIDGDWLPDNRFNFSVKAAGPDASVLDKVAGTSLPAEPFMLMTGISGSPSKFDLKGLDVTLGKSQAKSDLTIGLGDIKQIKGTVNSPHLDISHWYSGDKEEEEEEKPEPAGNREWMFDDTPIMSLTEHGLDIDLDLKIDVLDLGNTNLTEIELGLVLAHQLLELNPLIARGTQGGHYNSSFKLDGRGSKPNLQLDIKGNDLRLGLAAVPGQDPSTFPPIDLDTTLHGMGRTRRELVSSLDGKYRMSMGSGQVANAGLDFLFSDFLTQLFTTLNPFAETSEYTKIDCAVAAADVVSGNVRVLPVIYHTEQLTILSEGTVDLKTEKIDLSFNTKPRTGIGLSAGTLINPLIKVGGRLTSPAVEMDSAETIKSGGLAVATLGISVLAKSMSDRFLSSPDPCGDALKEIAKRDSAAN